MKKRILLLLANFFALNITAEIPHGKEHDFMLIASPSSGSTFLLEAIQESLPHMQCKNETFNMLFRRSYFLNIQEKIRYSPTNPDHLQFALQELPINYLENEYQKLWKNDEYKVDKEVFTALFIPFFYKKFSITCLYRHRKYTFRTNGKKEKIFKALFISFIKADYKNHNILKKMQTFFKSLTMNDLEKSCAGHIIYNYILFYHSALYDLPVILYENLIALSESDLKKYLKKRIPTQFHADNLTEIIVKKRKDIDFMKAREQEYQKIGIEPFCLKLIAFIKKLDPHMPYWHLLE